MEKSKLKLEISYKILGLCEDITEAILSNDKEKENDLYKLIGIEIYEKMENCPF